MPKALQAREARRLDSRKLLCKTSTVFMKKCNRLTGRVALSLDKWAQAYRTKIALKAIAYVSL